jgi:hypothetical protein
MTCACQLPDGIFPKPLPVEEAAAAVGKLDGYAGTESDQADSNGSGRNSRATS